MMTSLGGGERDERDKIRTLASKVSVFLVFFISRQPLNWKYGFKLSSASKSNNIVSGQHFKYSAFHHYKFTFFSSPFGFAIVYSLQFQWRFVFGRLLVWTWRRCLIICYYRFPRNFAIVEFGLENPSSSRKILKHFQLFSNCWFSLEFLTFVGFEFLHFFQKWHGLPKNVKGKK